MKWTKRHILMATLAYGVLLAAAIIGGLVWNSAHNALAVAQADLAAGQELQQTIGMLRSQPLRIGARPIESDDLIREIEKAAATAGLSPAHITSVTPGNVRRLGESVYQEKPTDLLLKQVQLRQLITFLYCLCQNNPGLDVQSIRLTNPSDQVQGNDDLWTVETTLSYLVYSPPNAKKESF